MAVALCHRRHQTEKDPDKDPDTGHQGAKILGCHKQSKTEMAYSSHCWAALDKY